MTDRSFIGFFAEGQAKEGYHLMKGSFGNQVLDSRSIEVFFASGQAVYPQKFGRRGSFGDVDTHVIWWRKVPTLNW